MQIKPYSHLWVALLWALSSCSPLPQTAGDLPQGQTPTGIESTPSASPTLILQAFIPTTASPSAIVAQTTNTPTSQCAGSRGSLDLQAATMESYPAAIEDYLNQGGSVKNLELALIAAGTGNLPQAAFEKDLTGDDRLDVVVSIVDPSSLLIPPSGVLLLFVCQDESYRLAHRLGPDPGQGAPAVRYVEDLNSDGLIELVSATETCGAHTCFEQIQVWSWDGTAFTDHLDGETSDIPYPDLYLTDLDGDGVFSLQIKSGMVGSVGAGLQRGFIRTWQYDRITDVWKMEGDIPEPSSYRLHAVQDADEAVREGDIDLALQLFDWVIRDDPPLQDYQSPQEEKINLTAYAYFREIILLANRNGDSSMDKMLSQMKEVVSKGSPQYAFVQMAEAYLASFSSGGATAACEVIRDFASTHALNVLQPLGPDVFGYAVPEKLPEDLCP